MNSETVIDEKALNDCLNEITRALLKADVHFDLVKNLKFNIKKIVNLDDLASGHNKRRIIQQILSSCRAISNELCKMLDTGKPSFMPKKGKASVIMFVGLQVIWFIMNSYMKSDPVKIAVEGVERFKKENCDLIIVDTSGRHQQEASLFEEMHQLAESTKPDLVIFVMDSSIGQAAFSQAQAFNRSVSVGAVIVTKTEGAAKGGGALSAVASTKSPFIFLGTGEHIIGDWSGFMEKIQDAVPVDQLSKLLQKLSEGKFSLRIKYQLYENLLNVGPINQIFALLPVDSAELKPKVYISDMLPGVLHRAIVNLEVHVHDFVYFRARGSGRQLRDVMEMLEEYKRQAKVWGKMQGFFKIPKKGEKSALSRNMNPQQMSKVLPPPMLKQLGGMMGMLGNMGGMDQ
ncbi:hypothetical protein C5167_018173 [Papaver somniferum]|uniref:SRP54-type proteins GTP-binding domain-containing protein n=1 Tax=Papaver somniferum TaxID=3469 RepID=A0A4Y7ILH3_PAPSO|nr:hypothetical protein C5167_018173 [Papaver somniferum]